MKINKIILNIIILSIIALILSGCGGGGFVTPPPPDSEPLETIIPDTTKVVEEETIQEIASITEDQSTIVFKKSTPQLEELIPGDIIVMGVTEHTPEGLLRKVKNITKGEKDSSEIIAETEFASLEEAIEQGEFYFNEALKAEDAKEPVCYIKGVEFIRDKSTIKDSKIQLLEFTFNINAIIYDEDNNPNTEEDNITLTGQISFDYNLLLSGKITFFQLKELNFQNIVKVNKKLGVTVGGSVKVFSYEKVLWTQDLGIKIISIGCCLPVVLHPKITISANVDGEIFAELTAEVIDTDIYTAGIQFDNGSWLPISSHKNYFSPPSLSLSTGGSVTFGVGPKIECKVDGVVGPYCKTTLYGKVIADIYTNPWWKIYVGIMAKAGVKIEIFSKVFASADLTILDLQKIIKQADGPFINLNHAPVITSTAVTSATKGQPYSYDVNATDSDGNTLVYSLTSKPSGMTINSSTGLITWTPTATGSFGVTVKASDGELFDTQSFTVTVEETGTTTPPPNPPTSLSPGTTSAPGPIISTLTPTLQWQAVSNADYYNLSVSIYPYGTSNIIYYNQQVYGNSITIPSGKLEAGKKYRWNMRAYNSAGYSDYSLDYYFQTGSTTTLPAVPTSLSPGTTSAPGPIISTLTPTLQWQAVSNADYYNLSVSIYPYGTSNIIYYNQQVYGNSITIPSGKLEAGKKYRWNMRAYNSAGYSDYSLDYYFQTGSTTTLPAVPTSLSPGTTSAPGPIISTLTPTLQWQAVSNADYYNLSVSIYPYGTSNIIYYNQQVYGNSITIPSGKLEAGKKYRWNMRAYNSAGYSDYSSDYYFQTGSTLGQVQLSGPSNGGTLPPMSVIFWWASVSNATKYQFILYNQQGQVALDTTNASVL